MISLREPDPDALPVEPVPEKTAVHVAAATSITAGSSVSITEACVAKLGPLLVTTIV